MSMDDRNPVVTQPTPVEVSGIRDPGMQALVSLAVSLGWNVLQKPHQPAVLTARDGHQRRIPTNTSVNISVFQQHLSAILAHSSELEPTVELVDAIVKRTKPSREHQRRLSLAVGETPAMHRERLANDRVAEDRREPDEHLTQRIEVPTTPVVDASERVLVSREPFIAHHTGGRKPDHNRVALTYVSDTSYKRVWSDGTVDYECMICGMAFSSPRGVGGHKQIHIRAGEASVTEQLKRPKGPPDPDHVIQPYGPHPIDSGEHRLMRKQLRLIRDALGLQDEDLVAERDHLLAELETCRERVRILEGNLRALREILSDLDINPSKEKK